LIQGLTADLLRWLDARRDFLALAKSTSAEQCPSGMGLDSVLFVVVIAIESFCLFIFDYNNDHDNRFADNDMAQQSCFRMETISLGPVSSGEPGQTLLIRRAKIQ
jgi:hypothetical protein